MIKGIATKGETLDEGGKIAVRLDDENFNKYMDQRVNKKAVVVLLEAEYAELKGEAPVPAKPKTPSQRISDLIWELGSIYEAMEPGPPEVHVRIYGSTHTDIPEPGEGKEIPESQSVSAEAGQTASDTTPRVVGMYEGCKKCIEDAKWTPFPLKIGEKCNTTFDGEDCDSPKLQPAPEVPEECNSVYDSLNSWCKECLVDCPDPSRIDAEEEKGNDG